MALGKSKNIFKNSLLTSLGLVTAILLLTAIFSGNDKRTHLAKIQERGSITLITRNSATAYYLGPHGYTGFEYDLATMFADFLGVDLVVRTADQFNLTIDGVAEASEFNGLEEIMSLMKGALDVQTDVRRHSISNVWYRSFTEEAATVVSYLTLMATEHGETKLITTGVYTDQVTKDGDTWVLVDRDLYLDRAY